jgi:hypothetical protein
MAEEVSELTNLQNKNSKLYKEKIIAQARVYDLAYKGKEEPTNSELKARIVYLESELRKVIRQREQYKGRNG